MATSAPDPAAQLKASAKELGLTLLDRVTQLGRDRIENLIGTVGENATAKLGEIVSSKLPGIGKGGKIGLAAAAGAAQAKLAGKNPLIGAIRAGVGAIPTKVKIAVAFGLVLVLLLAPVVAVLLLLALLVIGIVAAVRGAAS